MWSTPFIYQIRESTVLFNDVYGVIAHLDTVPCLMGKEYAVHRKAYESGPFSGIS